MRSALVSWSDRAPTFHYSGLHCGMHAPGRLDSHYLLSYAHTTLSHTMLPSLPETTKADDETLSTACISPTSSLNSVETPHCLKIRSRSVRFASDADLTMKLPPGADISEDERSALWYTKEEYRLMKRSYSFIVRLMESKQGLDEDEMCFRGLETKTRSGARRRRQNIESSMDAVIWEQERQWEENSFSTIRLAKAYRHDSAQCSMAAYLVGQKDAQFIHGKKI
jgi:hypothetical protein